MKKILALFLFALLLGAAAAGTASADPKITLTVYKCMVCDKEFYSFPGDPSFDEKRFKDTPDQLKYMFKFVDYGERNLNVCKNGFKTHIFDKKGTTTVSLSTLTNFRFAENVGVIKDGGSLNNIKLTEWECVYCKKPFYSINDEDLNVKDWDRQSDYIINLKGRGIQKCPSGTWGHAFRLRTTRSLGSQYMAKNVDKIYFTK